MLKLMKLEFAKDKYRGNVIAFIAIVLSVLLLSGLGGSVVDEGDKMFFSGYDVIKFGILFFRISFGIAGGVFISEIIINEFRKGTVKLLFTYPVSRKKIMGCKLLIVFLSIAIEIILANLIFILGMSMINRVILIVPEMITLTHLFNSLPDIIFGAFATAGLSLISLFFGMRKKSVSATIVAAVLINTFLNSTVNGSENLFNISVIPAALCLVGIGIAVYSYRNIEKIDL